MKPLLIERRNHVVMDVDSIRIHGIVLTYLVNDYLDNGAEAYALPVWEASGRKKMPARDDTGVDELGEAADQLFLSMRRARGNPAATGGLSLAQLTFLEPLVAGGSTHRRTARRSCECEHAQCNADDPTARGQGHVVRERSRTDERKVLVHLTDTGAKLLTRLRANRRATQASAYAAFTPDERVELACQLRRLAEIIDGTA